MVARPHQSEKDRCDLHAAAVFRADPECLLAHWCGVRSSHRPTIEKPPADCPPTEDRDVLMPVVGLNAGQQIVHPAAQSFDDLDEVSVWLRQASRYSITPIVRD